MLLERHFSNLTNDLDPFQRGNIIYYCLSFEHGRHAGPQLESYEMRSRGKAEDQVHFVTDETRPFKREALASKVGWTIRIGKKIHDLRAAGGERFTFIFDPLPMHTFIRHLVEIRLKNHLKTKGR
ncbi:hypothetical protein IDJ77_16330 [Mucilaginibacter sp. ZT4R22]|uniref:Uncharacterized protein n=1 Tax=Mucilaginibacter pankratovii TaxID=2772110 RepID=A0ABR7WSV4_9SPHI|nr:hypothetical protein [Mucilaginibacter pankratovii]MBD1365382.1 hypothetical protein [Mucilaginibacter pankratovii]